MQATPKEKYCLDPVDDSGGSTASETFATDVDVASAAPISPSEIRKFIIDTAKKLARKAKTSAYRNQIGIADAMHKMGKVLLERDGDVAGARTVLRHTEELQKSILQENILAVASALKEQSKYYKRNNKSVLAHLYRRSARHLSKEPTADNLHKAWVTHTYYKDTADTEELKKLARMVERHLKRSSRTAKALCRTLTLQARCCAIL